MRPLDFLGRIKVKLGLVIVLAVVTAFFVNEMGIGAGLSREVRVVIAAALAMIMVQILAMGMTKPLREMAAAAQTIAKGRYGLRVSATSRDEVGELARAFNAMAADLGEVDRQRRELVANVSHELRTPITGLQALLENVVDGVSAPNPEIMGTALAQTQRLGRLVAQLLDLSRFDAGTRQVEAETVDLESLCRQAAGEAALARDDVPVKVSVPAGLTVRADAGLLSQVLANLLDNAVRHSPRGGVVRLDARADGSGVLLAVADAGPGIPAEDRSRVFERFYRLDAGRAADAGGAGLGLAIAKEIVELHEGTIAVGDHPTGCHMLVQLPGRRPMPSPTPDPSVSSGGSALSGEAASVPSGGSAPGGETTSGAAPVPSGEAASAGESALITGPAPSAEAASGAAPVAGPESALKAESPSGAASAQAGDPPPNARAADRGAESGAKPSSEQPTRPGRARPGSVEREERVRERSTEETRPQGLPVPEVAQPLSQPVLYGRPPRVVAPRQQVSPGRAGMGAGMGMLTGTSIGIFLVIVSASPMGVVLLVLLSCGGSVLGAMLASRTPELARRREQAEAGGPRGRAAAEYVPPSLFPMPVLPATPTWVLPATAGAALVGAVAAPYAPIGIGLALTAIAMGAVVIRAVVVDGPRRITGWTVACWVLAYALVALAVLRSAPWVVGPLLLAAAALMSVAVAGTGRTLAGAVRGMLAVGLSSFVAPQFLWRPAKAMARRGKVLPLLLSLLITGVLVGVFGLLFSSADAVFSAFVDDLLVTPDWLMRAPFRIFVFFVVALLVGGGVVVALRPAKEPAAHVARIPVARTLWVMPLAGLNMLFAAFVTVQITVLFGGNRRVIETSGLTFAEYARSGFFELLTVSVFVLGIVGLTWALLKLRTPADRWLLAGLLGLLGAFTLVILFSAVHRLDLYVDAYGFTRLRATVWATTWWLAAVFTIVLIAGALRLIGKEGNWLPRTMVLLTGASLLVFGGWNPDARIAETQVSNRGIERLDQFYVGSLSPDAVPAVSRLPEPIRSCVLNDIRGANDLGASDPWNGWNLARVQAKEILRTHPIEITGDCVSKRE